jgi:class 3 adenylate cyclase
MALHSRDKNSIPVENGEIDLTEWDCTVDEPILLEGEWQFYWKEFLDPYQTYDSLQPILLKVPGRWRDEKGKSENFGWGTYRLKIHFSHASNERAIKLDFYNQAFKLYANGTLLAENGDLEIHRSSMNKRYKPDVFILPSDKDVELILQTSCFDDLRGGFESEIQIGSLKGLSKNQTRNQYLELTLFAVLFVIGVYHIFFYLALPSNKAALWFGFLSLVLSLRSLIYGEAIILFFWPDLPFEVHMALGHISFYLGVPVFWHYFKSLFERNWMRKVSMALMATGLFYSCLVLFLPHVIYIRFLFSYQLISIAVLSLAFLVLIYEIIQHNWLSYICFSGFVVLALFFINDFLYSYYIIHTAHLMPLGIVLFVFIQAILISLKNASNYYRSENLSIELQSINDSLRRFVPEEFLLYLKKKNLADISLGDHIQKYMTILFCDIRDFTELSDDMEPKENFDFINTFLGKMGPVIRKNGGFIDKYIGDGIMALFPDVADHAVEAAIEMHKELAILNKKRRVNGEKTITMGIGIHTGSLMLGTVGENMRMDSTVISDSVNMCSRIDHITKEYGMTIGVSDRTFSQLENPNKYNYRFIGKVPVKGKKEPIALFDFIDGDLKDIKALKIDSKSAFEDSVFHFYNNRVAEAVAGFHSSLRIFPGDKASIKYIERAGKELY